MAKGEWGQGGGRRASEDWSWVSGTGGWASLWSGERLWAMEIAIRGPAGAAGGSCDAAGGAE